MNKILGGILIFIAFCIIVFGITYASLGYEAFFGPKFKEVERNIWEETPSRVHGAIQEIASRRIEYVTSDDLIEKQAICSFLRDGYSELNPEYIDNYELRRFFEACMLGDTYE